MPDAPIEYLPLDLASFSSIADAANTFKSKEKRLDLLINNAGIMAVPYSLTSDGYEIQFGTNHLGHALLTKLLLPVMLETAKEPGADVRIINVSSLGLWLAPSGGINWDQNLLEKQYTLRRYGQSKLANVLFTRELAARYPQIKSVALHPGVIITDLYATLNKNPLLNFCFGALGHIYWLFPGGFKDAAGGALNQTWAATTQKEKLQNGGLYFPVGRPMPDSRYSRDLGLAKKLWEWTDAEFEKHGY